MTREELRAEFRVVTQDKVAPYLFENDIVDRWLAEAEAEAAIRGRLLHESGNALVCQVPVSAGSAVYPLHQALYEIDHIAFRLSGATTRTPVRLSSPEELDRTLRDWRDLTGTPTHAIQGDSSIRLVPTPDADGTLLLEGYRLPLSSTGKLEIHAAHHRHLVHWALHRAFGLPDSETLDLGKAADAERAFTHYFGSRPDSDLRRSTREDESHTNKAFWV